MGICIPTIAALLFVAGCRKDEPEESEPEDELSVILGVDASRDGVIDFDDPDDLEHRHDPAPGFGALFLPNFDDASGRCAGIRNDADWEACHDALLDHVVNEVDLAGMAKIRTSPLGEDVPQDAVGRLTIDDASIDRVRLHLRTGDGEGPDAFTLYPPGDPIDAAALAHGVDFAIEGLSWRAKAEEWSGRVELTFSLELPERDEPIEDRAHMDVAPIVFPNHMSPAAEVFVANLGTSNAAFRRDLRSAVQQAGVPEGFTELSTYYDAWMQDVLLTAYMSIPGPDGPKFLRLYFRSANLNYPASLEPVFKRIYQIEREPMPTLLREAGVVAFKHFHGSERAGRAEYHPEKGFEPIDLTGVDVDDVVRYLYGSSSSRTYPHIADHIDKIWDADTLDSFGNTETTPPYLAQDGTFYPFGRVYRGFGGATQPDLRPDPTLTGIIEAQRLQPILWLPTTWLLVAHVDETVSFVPTETERGYSLLYSAPLEAVEVLERVRDEMGGGSAILFAGRQYPDYDGGWSTSAAVTVTEVLNDTNVMASTARAAVEIAAQLDILVAEMDLAESDLVPVPFLFEDIGWGGLSAFQPGMINGISFNADYFGMPQPEGPVIGGVDVFEALVEERLSPLGITVNWIDSWDVYHVGLGGVHCGTNSERVLPDVPWWTKEIEL